MVKPAAGRFLVERPAPDGRTAVAVPTETAEPETPTESASAVAVADVPGLAAPETTPARSETDAVRRKEPGAASPAEDPSAGPSAAVVAALELMASRVEPVIGTSFARRSAASVQFVDPAVTRGKFEAQLAAFLRHEMLYRARGLVLVEAMCPRLLFMACVPQVRPAAVLFGVLVDYTNFDTESPSVRIVDPFTRRALRPEELSSWLKRQAAPAAGVGVPNGTMGDDADPSAAPEGVPPAPPPAPPPAAEPVPLLQWWGPHDTPFLCLPGVREYHDHPGHSGDPWWLHRARGAGQLDALLDVIATYGIQPITAYGFHVPIKQPEGAPPQFVLLQAPAVMLVSPAVPR